MNLKSRNEKQEDASQNSRRNSIAIYSISVHLAFDSALMLGGNRQVSGLVVLPH